MTLSSYHDQAATPQIREEPNVGAPALSSRAKLIMLENAGALVTTNARANAGQELSRLLRISDGMLGQGANISVLVTTNEEFDELDVDASRGWLAAHDVEHDPTGPMSLAQLYAIQRGDRIIRLDDISGEAG